MFSLTYIKSVLGIGPAPGDNDENSVNDDETNKAAKKDDGDMVDTIVKWNNLSPEGKDSVRKLVDNLSLQVQKVESVSLDPRPDYLAYKVVTFCKAPDGSGQYENVKALLHMQIPAAAHIYTSDGGAGIPTGGTYLRVLPSLHGMRDTQKYCTNNLYVTGVQFFGEPQAVKDALINYQMSRGFLLSGFSGGNRYQYRLEMQHLEPRAGDPGTGCTHGLHFFTDSASALQYGGYHKPSAWKEYPVVAKRLNKGRGMVFCIEEEDADTTGIVVQAVNTAAGPLPPAVSSKKENNEVEKLTLDWATRGYRTKLATLLEKVIKEHVCEIECEKTEIAAEQTKESGDAVSSGSETQKGEEKKARGDDNDNDDDGDSGEG